MFDGKPFSYKPIEKISKELFAGGDKPDDFSLQHNEVYRYPIFSNGKIGNDLLCYCKEYRVSEPALTISARGTIGYTAIREAWHLATPLLLHIACRASAVVSADGAAVEQMLELLAVEGDEGIEVAPAHQGLGGDDEDQCEQHTGDEAP